MSSFSISNYYNELEKIIRFGGSKKETAIRNAFYYLLNDYAKQKELMLVAEISTKNKSGKLITPDGTLKDYIRNDWGYWESKDESDDINEEIKKKFAKGYPNDNILFEDSQTAVLFQHGEEVLRVNMKVEMDLNLILSRFINYERPEVHDFRQAIQKFKEDIPKVTEAIKNIIDEQEKINKELIKSQKAFLILCQSSIDPAITDTDVIEMMVQHILSADIFNTIFDEPHFHQENNIANELNKVVGTFFVGNIRRQTLAGIKHYYDAINARAAGIADHHEKQIFLKIVYENFYKGYNPKAADRLGIVYTPNEIVQFMIKSTDILLHQHFGKTLADKNVEILDPATGTGTFICDIIDYLPANKLKEKYKNEIHANEISILPYYIANLNIEFTYKQKIGNYEEFKNLCFVDTLDNTGFNWIGKQGDLFGVSLENAERIKRQNLRKISVIIGNPPYNANQQSENDNNKNKKYPIIDQRIKDTFIKNSTAQKTKLYDMYSRFYRWAMDRLNDNGIIAFVTNRSFIDSRTFDGFRKTIQDEYDFAYIIDTKSDVRQNPNIAGSTHNVFGIMTGVAILLLVKVSHKKVKISPCKISYVAMEDTWLKDEKLQWLLEHSLTDINFDNITPDKNNTWLNIQDNDWNELIPLGTKEVKGGKGTGAIFKLYSNGVVTARDEWVRSYSKQNIKEKVNELIHLYNTDVNKLFGKVEKAELRNELDYSFKWSRAVKNDLSKGKKYKYDDECIIKSLYRPFVTDYLYFSKELNEMQNQLPYIFGKHTNTAIAVNSGNDLFSTLASKYTIDFGLLKFGNGNTQCFPLYRYDGEIRIENITEWSLELFRNRYSDNSITKVDIFNYAYAVLHNPTYLKKYEHNLKRDLPRVPMLTNFKKWVSFGKELISIHTDFENYKKFPLRRLDNSYDVPNVATIELLSKPKLKANKLLGTIEIDGYTTLENIPKEAWEYKLGTRSALEWVLEKYKQSKSSDKTIEEKFNTYNFKDIKEFVIDLLERICSVSIDTIKIVKEMKEEYI